MSQKILVNALPQAVNYVLTLESGFSRCVTSTLPALKIPVRHGNVISLCKKRFKASKKKVIIQVVQLQPSGDEG